MPAVAAAGCAGAGFHDLHRLNATTLVVGGIDVKTAQTRLGHADPRVTLSIYASAPASVDRAAASSSASASSVRTATAARLTETHTAKSFRAISAPIALSFHDVAVTRVE